MLDWSDPRNNFFYLGLVIIALIAFALLYCTAGLREWLATGRCCCACCCCACCERGDEGALVQEGFGKAAGEDVAVAVPGSVNAMHRL